MGASNREHAVPAFIREIRGQLFRPEGRGFGIVLAALFAVAPPCAAQSATERADSAHPGPLPPPAIRREFRGAWVATVANIDWPSRPGLSTWEQQAELLAIMNRAAALNFNAVLLQVRPAADALYDSPHEPWSEYLTGTQGKAPEPYYDPLRFAVEAAHARGLELHAWFNPYRARHARATGPLARTHLGETRPDLVKTYGTYQWMDPGEPAVIAQTLRVILDVVRRYDVDGIHLDDYFYPYPVRGADSVDVPFPDSASYAAYRRRGGNLRRDDWRRRNVDTLMHRIYRRTKALKPWVKVGISPFGIWRPGHPEQIAGFDAYSRLYADSRKWLREGWLDYFTPQLYWPVAQQAQSYPVLLRWWLSENVKGRHMWPGHSASRAAGCLWPRDELLEQVRLTRREGGTGDIHFSMRALMPGIVEAAAGDTTCARPATETEPRREPSSPGDRLRAELYDAPAVVPASPWLSRVRPVRPAALFGTDSATGEHVLRLVSRGARAPRWWTVRVLSDGRWRSWVLPGAQRRLVVAAADAARPERAIVTAVDRYGSESPPAELRSPRPAATLSAAAFPFAVDSVHTRAVRDGVVQHSIYSSAGPWVIRVLSVELDRCWVAKALKPAGGAVGREKTSAMLRTLAARAAVAGGVNADFFLFTPPGVPTGAHVSGGRVITGPGAQAVLVFDSLGAPRIADLRALGSATVGGRRFEVAGWNREVRRGLAWFDGGWGGVTDTASSVTEVVLAGPPPFRATLVDTTLAGVAIPAKGAVLRAGRDAPPELHTSLLALRPGDTVPAGIALVPLHPREAVGGRPVLVRDSSVTADVDTPGQSGFAARHPRTAAGIGRNGKRLLLVVVDGRQKPYSDGMTLRELAELMRALGARDAINFDGGGSTTMVVADPDAGGTLRIANRPSDREGERPVANALAIVRCGGE